MLLFNATPELESQNTRIPGEAARILDKAL